MTDDKKLVREDDARPRARGRVERAAEGEEDAPRGRREGRRARRASVQGEVMDMQRGAAYASIEAAAATMDIVAHLLRSTVDRTFARDYREPGDLLRGVTRDAGDALTETLGEVRDVPQRLNDAFYEAAPRRSDTDRGERHRRAHAARSSAHDDQGER